MSKAANVLNMLIPDGGWVLHGDTYEGITFLNCEPITKKQFEDGFDKYDAWKSKQDEIHATAKQVILDRLGITEDEAKLLLS